MAERKQENVLEKLEKVFNKITIISGTDTTTIEGYCKASNKVLLSTNGVIRFMEDMNNSIQIIGATWIVCLDYANKEETILKIASHELKNQERLDTIMHTLTDLYRAKETICDVSSV